MPAVREHSGLCTTGKLSCMLVPLFPLGILSWSLTFFRHKFKWISQRETPMLFILPFPNPYSAHTRYTISLFSPVSRDAKCSPELLPLWFIDTHKGGIQRKLQDKRAAHKGRATLFCSMPFRSIAFGITLSSMPKTTWCLAIPLPVLGRAKLYQE